MSAEQKECVGNKEIHLILLFDDGSKGINTVPHVGVPAYDVIPAKAPGFASLSMTHRLDERPDKSFRGG